MYKEKIIKKILITLGASLLLIGCAAPTYDQTSNPTNVAPVISNAKEIVRINGNVIEVTENNVIRVRVPRKGELIEDGISLDTNNVVEVSLGLVELPLQNSPVGVMANIILTDILNEQEIDLTLLDAGQALITLQGSDESIQEMLINAGLALVKSGETNALTSKLTELQEVAELNNIGVWSIDRFTSFIHLLDKEIMNSTQFTESQFSEIIEQFDVEGWIPSNDVKGEWDFQ